MFCLRSWMLPLLFLSQAPPLYLLLFVIATYILQRPCLYCTLLLFLIIITLFDFQSNWFGDSPTDDASTLNTPASTTTNPLADIVQASVAAATSALNQTASAAVEMAGQKLQRSTGLRSGWSWGRTGLEWLKEVGQRREVRIHCINTIIRL